MLEDHPNPVGVLRSKASGEPPLCMSVSVALALKRAVEATRKDRGILDYFELRKFFLYVYFSWRNFLSLSSISGVEDTRLEAKAKDTKKIRGQDHKKKSEAKAKKTLPRTDPLEAKDRNARSQGQGPRTLAHAFSKKKVFKIFFSGDLQKRKTKKVFAKFSVRFLAFSYIFLKINKSLLL